MVESTCFQHTSSHPDKYNNSVDRIISKEEEREDPRRDSSIYLRVQNTVVFPHFYSNSTRITRSLQIQCIPTRTTRTTVFLHAIQQVSSHPMQETILHTELILLQELQGSSRASKASSSNCSPCIQAFYMAESSYKAPYSIPGPHSTSRLPVILPGRNSILHGSQHPRSPYSNSQASSTVLHYRILPGEIGFIPRVKYCISNTILRSVCSNLFILMLRIILQEI